MGLAAPLMIQPPKDDAARFLTGLVGAFSIEAFAACGIGWLVTRDAGFGWGVAASGGGLLGYGALCWRLARRAQQPGPGQPGERGPAAGRPRRPSAGRRRPR